MKGMVAGIALALVMGSAAHAATVEERYNASCTFCHSTGAAGAPKSHDEAAWKPRMDKGMDTMVKHVKEGFNAMPPKGMCNDCSDDEYRALIEYMANSK